jgi:myo-inositol-1(or 4)-monophosphatase
MTPSPTARNAGQNDGHDDGYDDGHDALAELAGRLAREAGLLVQRGRRGGIDSVVTKSSATDVVTEFDRASEELIVGQLARHRPNDTIVGEEGSERSGTSGITWLIDPIDGTTNFLYDLPGWAVSIAAVDHAGPIVGAVYVPGRDELFTAHRGGGSRCNGRPIACTTLGEPAHALLATGFSYVPERRAAHAARVARLIDQVRDIRRLGAASVDLCYVACGRLDAYFEENLGPWDLAAGELIAREAGCRTGDLLGGVARPEQVLAANPALFEPLAELIRMATS